MLSPRLTNCVECTTIPVLLNDIDCKIAQLAGNLYNNIVFMLNQPVPANVMIDLLNYRRILTFKYCNPDYAGCFTIPMIASKVKILTVNNKPIARPSCGITTTTTSSTTANPTTSTTSTSSSTTTTTTNSGLIYSISTDQSMSCAGYGNSILLTPGNLFSPFCFQDTYYGNVSMYNNNTVVYIKDALSENVRAYTTWGTYLQSYGPCVNCSTITTSSTSTSTSSSTTTSTTTAAPTTTSTSTSTSTSSTTTTTTTTIYPVEYGLLYNWYAVTDARNIAADGWEVPTISDYQTLADYLGASGSYITNTIGGKLKDTSLTYWNSPNAGATNEVGFNGRGSGGRSSAFIQVGMNIGLWTIDNPFTGSAFLGQLFSSNQTFPCTNTTSYPKYTGYSLRLKKTSTTLVNGQTGTYVGNDGKIYRTICIGTQEWLASNLAETRFRNGNIITYNGLNNPNNFTDSEWAVLTTAGTCAYNNDVSNVAPGFTFPT